MIFSHKNKLIIISYFFYATVLSLASILFGRKFSIVLFYNCIIKITGYDHFEIDL